MTVKADHNRGTYMPAETERMNEWAIRIWSMITMGNGEGAHEVVDACLLEQKSIQRHTKLLDTPLSEVCGDDVRMVNALEQYAGCYTLGEALSARRCDLVAIPNFGAKSIERLFAFAAKFAIARCEHLEAELDRRRKLAGEC